MLDRVCPTHLQNNHITIVHFKSAPTKFITSNTVPIVAPFTPCTSQCIRFPSALLHIVITRIRFILNIPRLVLFLFILLLQIMLQIVVVISETFTPTTLETAVTSKPDSKLQIFEQKTQFCYQKCEGNV